MYMFTLEEQSPFIGKKSLSQTGTRQGRNQPFAYL